MNTFVQLSFRTFCAQYPDHASAFPVSLLKHLLSDADYIVRFPVSEAASPVHVEVGYLGDKWHFSESSAS